MAVIINVWKPDNFISLTQKLWKILDAFVNVRFIRVGLSGFLKQVGTSVVCFKLYWSVKFLRESSSFLVLKSPTQKYFHILPRV